MNQCNIVKDLMPLYADEVASGDSVAFIEEHMKTCADCRDAWRRCRTELPNMEVAEAMVKDYKTGIQRGTWKIMLSALLGWLLVAAIVVGAFFYYHWEKGDFTTGKRYSAPDGVRSIELVNLDDAGFFSGKGNLLRFYFERGYMNRYETEWQDLVVYWAPDSQTSLLEVQNGSGERELRIVDQTGGLPSGGTREIPGLYPSEEEPDLTQILTELCAKQGVAASDFEFVQWSDDSLGIQFRFQTTEGEIGELWFSLDGKEITEIK